MVSAPRGMRAVIRYGLVLLEGWRSIRNRSRRWLSIVSLLRFAGWPILVWSVLVNLVIGLMPVVFILETSIMLSRIPALSTAPHRSGFINAGIVGARAGAGCAGDPEYARALARRARRTGDQAD